MDDLNIPISDDELLEDVMSVRPPRKKDYKVCKDVCVYWIHTPEMVLLKIHCVLLGVY